MVVMNDGMIQVNMALKKVHTFLHNRVNSSWICLFDAWKKVPNIVSQMLIYHGRIRKFKKNPNHSSEKKNTVSKPFTRMSQKGSKWFVNAFFHLLINGACWGDITHFTTNL